MTNMEEILARLDAGESADAIAAEMTNALNAAIDEKNARAASQKAKEEELNTLATNMMQAIKAYMVAAHPDMDWDFIDALPANETRAELEQIIPLLKMFDKVKVHHVVKKPLKVNNADTADATLAKFLSSMGLL